jgi:chromate reductase
VTAAPDVDRLREPVRFLVFSASLRQDSLNTRLAQLASLVLEADGAEVDRASMRDFDVPSYDGDVQEGEGFPRGAVEFRRRLEAADAFVISAPDFNERSGLLLSASPSMVGGNRGAWALRVPFEHLGARIYPDMFSLARAHNAFHDDGRLSEPQLQERFETNIRNFIDTVEANKHYPCVKRAWVEYLGEQPEPAIDRVETTPV